MRIAILAAALCLPCASPAQPVTGYATGPGAAIWKTPYGLCWRTTAWTAASATAECDPDLVRKPVAAAPPPPPPPAPVVQPAPPPAPIAAPPPPPVAPIAKPAPAPAPKPAPAKSGPLTIGAAELFGFNQATLTPAGRAKLDKEVIQRANREYADIRAVNINGHTDRLGSPDYNQKLSERRAEAVRAYLVSRGMDGSKIESYGYGKTMPVKSCPDKVAGKADRKALIACLAPNRRVEIEITGTRR
jgi:OOP family OmpA-OmpF porin